MAISGRPNEKKPNAGKARVPPPPAPVVEASGPGASVDTNFHGGWYCLRDDVRDKTCVGDDINKFLPQMARVEVSLPYATAFQPTNDTLKVMADKLMPLLHKVMHPKALHLPESMLAAHEVEDGLQVAPHGCWQFMWPVKKVSGNNTQGRPGWQMYECYKINTGKQLRLGTHVVGCTVPKQYLKVWLGYYHGRHPPA